MVLLSFNGDCAVCGKTWYKLNGKREEDGYSCGKCGSPYYSKPHQDKLHIICKKGFAEKPRILWDLPPGHPDRIQTNKDQARRYLSENNYYNHPADESGAKSALGDAPEDPSPEPTAASHWKNVRARQAKLKEEVREAKRR